MKITYLNFNLLVFLLTIGLSFNSCSDNDNSAKPPNSDDNSYSLTIEGDKTYTNSGSFDGDSEEEAIVSIYSKTLEGDQAISLIIADDPNNLSLTAALSLNLKTQQPLPLGNLKTVEAEDLGHSYIVITIGNTNYISNSGSAKLSNLKMTPLSEYTGFASYTLEIDGKFDITDTENVEQINIKGIIKTVSYF